MQRASARAAGFAFLLLEAGEDDPWIWLKVPLGAGKILYRERSLWRSRSEPELHMAGRRVFWPRGRVLGASRFTPIMVGHG